MTSQSSSGPRAQLSMLIDLSELNKVGLNLKYRRKERSFGVFLLSYPITFLFEKKMTFLTVFLLNLYNHMPLDCIIEKNETNIYLKVRQFQNEFKYALTTQGRNTDNFLFVFWEK